ncbi:hypothetical protein H9P43_004410 [Blastocladiella emersonii ATCC 22665]|nr:hypothetical protein H9P43_004410 [Blastocladiella emersonii ATCC 22665]
MSHPLDDPLSAHAAAVASASAPAIADPLSAPAPVPNPLAAADPLSRTHSRAPSSSGAARTVTATVDPFAFPPPLFVAPAVVGEPHAFYDPLLPAPAAPSVILDTHAPGSLSAIVPASSSTVTDATPSPEPPAPTTTTTAEESDQVFALTLANRSLDLRNLLELHPDVSVNVPHPVSRLTPLHLAATRGYDAVVHVLLENGAIVDLADPDLETALHKAAFNGNVFVVEKLLHARANLNAKDRGGWTPLHVAVARNHHEIAHLLLNHPAIDVNAVNAAGTSPLMLACAKGNSLLIKVLLRKGANSATTNRADESAYDLAALAMHTSVCQYLARTNRALVRHTRLRCVAEIVEKPAPAPSAGAAVLAAFGRRRSRTASNSSSGSPAHRFLEFDPTNDDADPREYHALDDVPLLPGWAWMTEWHCIEDWATVPDPDAPEASVMGTSVGSTSSAAAARPWLMGVDSASGFVDPPRRPVGNPGDRTRQWARVMRKQLPPVAAAQDSVAPSEAAEPAAESAADYMARARAILDDTQDANVSEFQRYQDAIQVLLAGIQDDADPNRKKDAKFVLMQWLETAEQLPDSARVAPSPTSSPSDPATRFLPTPQPWTPDAQAAACHGCARQFTFFLRRHHCRLCGKVFCAPCSARRLQLKGLYPDAALQPRAAGMARLCEPCFHILEPNTQSQQPQVPRRVPSPLAPSRASPAPSAPAVQSPSPPIPPTPPTPHPRRVGELSRTASVASIASSVGSLGSLVECPGCLRPLRAFGSQDARENHVSECLAGVAAGTSPAAAAVIRAAVNRYTVDVWQQPAAPRPVRDEVEVAAATPVPQGREEGEVSSSDDDEDEEDEGPVELPSRTRSASFQPLVDPSSECLICYESYAPGDRVIRMACLCCYHVDCATAWFNKHRAVECPMHVAPLTPTAATVTV